MRVALLLCLSLAELWSCCKAEDYVCTNGQTTVINITAGQSAWFQTKGFPNPYPVPSPKCIFQFTAPTGYAVRLLFQQFFTDLNDELQFCLTLQSSPAFCTSLSGDPMDFSKQDLVYSSGDQQFFATFFSLSSSVVSQPAPFVNSGFRGKAVAYQKSQDGSCSPTSLQLSNGDGDIIISPKYPISYAPNLNCVWTITAPDRFRLVLNEFHIMASDAMTIYDASGNVFQRLSGDVTFDEPKVFYMEKSAKLEFHSGSTVSMVPGFYITINAYSSSDSPNTCPTSGDIDLIALGNKGTTISTPSFGLLAYPNNLVCQWKVKNSNKTSAIVTELWLETEHCCDILEVRDMVSEPLQYRGKEARVYSLSNVPELLINFSSDGALASSGFQAVIKAVDCTCDSMKDIELNANTPSIPLHSPGFSTGVGYCNGLQCGWVIRAPPANFILISLSSLQLRREPLFEGDGTNELVIRDQFGNIIANYTSQNNSDVALADVHVAGHFAQITFTSDQFFPSDVIARGFALTATMISPAPTVQINQSLTEASFAMPIERIMDNTVNYMGLWTVRARSGRRVRFYNFAINDPRAQLILFDGPDMESPPINSSYSSSMSDVSISQANVNATTGKVNPVVSSGEFMTVVYFSQSTGGSVRFAALLSDYEDDNYESLCGGFAYVHHSANSSPMQVEHGAVTNQQCRSVLYAFKDAGTPTYTDAINFNFQNVGDSFSVFRGISIDAQFLIANSPPYPIDIYGTFVTLQFIGGISLSFQFTALNIPQINMPSADGVIMSPDYKSNGIPEIKQSYLWTGHDNGLVFNLETQLYSGTLDIVHSVYAESQNPIRVTSQNDKRTIKICGTYVLITYKSNTVNGSGFLASYEQSTEKISCNFACMLRCDTLVAFLCFCLALLSLL